MVAIELKSADREGAGGSWQKVTNQGMVMVLKSHSEKATAYSISERSLALFLRLLEDHHRGH